jgi:hypothetical protein
MPLVIGEPIGANGFLATGLLPVMNTFHSASSGSKPQR